VAAPITKETGDRVGATEGKRCDCIVRHGDR
jgi:hypothetical protein